jgi:hypothetical protein
MALAPITGWFAATELAGLLIVMALAGAALVYNKQVARALANMTDAHWPPGGLIREDRPEKIQQQREFHRTARAIARPMVVVFALFALGTCIVALIRGPN